jgi:hypothetical protein
LLPKHLEPNKSKKLNVSWSLKVNNASEKI